MASFRSRVEKAKQKVAKQKARAERAKRRRSRPRRGGRPQPAVQQPPVQEQVQAQPTTSQQQQIQQRQAAIRQARIARLGRGRGAVVAPSPSQADIQRGRIGGVFLTEEEARARGIEPMEVEGTEKPLSQRQIEFAERVQGREPGSSGTVAIERPERGFRRGETRLERGERVVFERIGRAGEIVTERELEERRGGLAIPGSPLFFVEGAQRIVRVPLTREQKIQAGSVVFTTGVVAGTLVKAPFVGRAAIESVFVTTGTLAATDPGRPRVERVLGGVKAGVAGTALAIELTPFIRGAFATKPVRIQPEGFKAVTGVTKKGRIGIIPPKSPRPPPGLSKSALGRGAFGRPRGIERQFIGRNQILVTSQRNFFRQGKQINLQREFFITPQDPVLRIGQARISRLGLVEPFRIPQATQVGFKISRPQIGFISRGTVAVRETRTAFALGRGTELEAIKTAGTIQGVTKVGTTALKGQAVEVFSFRVAPGVPGAVTTPAVSTTTATIPATSPLAGITSPTTTFRTPTAPTRPVTSPRIPAPPVTPPITKIIRIDLSPPTRGRSRPSPQITTPPIPTTPTTPTVPTIPTAPTIPTTPILPRVLVTRPQTPRIRRRGVILPRARPARFPVEVRRFGTFRVAGVGRTPREAVSIGRRKTETTLAASFRVPGVKPTKLSGFKLKGNVFIEKRSRRLKETGEIYEIQKSKRKKRRKKK